MDDEEASEGSEEILRALQRILERWQRKHIKADEARREVDRIVFGTLFVGLPVTTKSDQ